MWTMIWKDNINDGHDHGLDGDKYDDQARHAGLGEREPAVSDWEDRGDGNRGSLLPAHGHSLPRFEFINPRMC